MRRIRKRAFQRFGARMLPGGDRYGQEEQFFGMAARRPEEERESWLKKPLSTLQVDGARAKEHNAELIVRRL